MGNLKEEEKGSAREMIVHTTNLTPLYTPNITAKILQVAHRALAHPSPLHTYPHTVPQTGPTAGRYEHREALFWTCGFFPGSIYVLLERAAKFPHAIRIAGHPPTQLHEHLLALGRHWTVAIKEMSGRTDTHDMGFIVQPALQKDWELTGDRESLGGVVRAAYALASRWDGQVRAIRSWDVAVNDRYSITDMKTDFLVIIDSMCNLDLLYYVGHMQHDDNLIRIATQHADTVMAHILRPDASSYHLVNFDPNTGAPKAKLTNQGHADDSTWSRGQAWAIMGFAQTYAWTKDTRYLDTAIRCAENFLGRLRECEAERRWHHPLVPAWDFNAEHADPAEPLRDVSAGVIAANGLLLIHQALQGLSASAAAQLSSGQKRGSEFYLDHALQIVNQTLDMSLDRDLASFAAASPEKMINGDGGSSTAAIDLHESGFDAILRHSTSNNNEHAHQKYWDHGLVYADYYLLEFGNKLLRAGLV